MLYSQPKGGTQAADKLSIPIAYNMSFLDKSISTNDKPYLEDVYTNIFSSFSTKEKQQYVNFLFTKIATRKAAANYSGSSLLYEFNLDQDILDCKGKSDFSQAIKVNPELRGNFKPKTDSSMSDENFEIMRSKAILTIDSLSNSDLPKSTLIERKYFTIAKHGFSMAFLENWEINYNAGRFTKEVQYFGINKFRFNLQNEPANWEDFLFVKNNAGTPNWKLYKKDVVYDVCIKKEALEYAKLVDDALKNIPDSKYRQALKDLIVFAVEREF